MTRAEQIEHALREAFNDALIRLHDDSDAHIGHAGARDGLGHFDLYIVSKRFAGMNLLERHRAVYDALGPLMQTDIHALSVRALSPEEDS